MTNLYKNKKNGSIYICKKEVINATNENDGQVMVLYSNIKNGKSYVREKNEFFEKFELYDFNKNDQNKKKPIKFFPF